MNPHALTAMNVVVVVSFLLDSDVCEVHKHVVQRVQRAVVPAETSATQPQVLASVREKISIKQQKSGRKTSIKQHKRARRAPKKTQRTSKNKNKQRRLCNDGCPNNAPYARMSDPPNRTVNNACMHERT